MNKAHLSQLAFDDIFSVTKDDIPIQPTDVLNSLEEKLRQKYNLKDSHPIGYQGFPYHRRELPVPSVVDTRRSRVPVPVVNKGQPQLSKKSLDDAESVNVLDISTQEGALITYINNRRKECDSIIKLTEYSGPVTSTKEEIVRRLILAGIQNVVLDNLAYITYPFDLIQAELIKSLPWLEDPRLEETLLDMVDFIYGLFENDIASEIKKYGVYTVLPTKTKSLVLLVNTGDFRIFQWESQNLGRNTDINPWATWDGHVESILFHVKDCI